MAMFKDVDFDPKSLEQVVLSFPSFWHSMDVHLEGFARSAPRCSEMGFSSNFRLRFSISIKITDSESASKIKNLNQRNFFFDPIFFPASPLRAGKPVLPVSNYRFIFSHTRVSTRRVGCHWNFENRNSGSNFMNFFLVRDFCEIFSQISRR